MKKRPPAGRPVGVCNLYPAESDQPFLNLLINANPPSPLPRRRRVEGSGTDAVGMSKTTMVLGLKDRPAQLIAILLELNVMFEDENPDMLVKELMDTLVKGLALSISKIPFSIYKPPELKETPDGDHVLPPV